MQVQVQDTRIQGYPNRQFGSQFHSPSLAVNLILIEAHAEGSQKHNCLRLEFRITNWLLRINNWNSDQISGWDLTFPLRNLPPFCGKINKLTALPPVIQMEIANLSPWGLYGILCLVSHCLIDLWVELGILFSLGGPFKMKNENSRQRKHNFKYWEKNVIFPKANYCSGKYLGNFK